MNAVQVYTLTTRRSTQAVSNFGKLSIRAGKLGQKQKDVTSEAMRTGRKPEDMLSVGRIKILMDDLVGMCNQLEPYGLVDFEMGIWEEQIIDVFIEGLDLLCPRAVETQRKAHV